MILTGEKFKNLEKNLSQNHFIYDRSQVDWPRIESRPSWLEASD
jgi:hypothetical protein